MHIEKQKALCETVNRIFYRVLGYIHLKHNVVTNDNKCLSCPVLCEWRRYDYSEYENRLEAKDRMSVSESDLLLNSSQAESPIFYRTPTGKKRIKINFLVGGINGIDVFSLGNLHELKARLKQGLKNAGVNISRVFVCASCCCRGNSLKVQLIINC